MYCSLRDLIPYSVLEELQVVRYMGSMKVEVVRYIGSIKIELSWRQSIKN